MLCEIARSFNKIITKIEIVVLDENVYYFSQQLLL